MVGDIILLIGLICSSIVQIVLSLIILRKIKREDVYHSYDFLFEPEEL